MKSDGVIELLKEILSDNGKPQDFAGNTRLTLFADKIKLLPPDNTERRRYIWAINKCADILHEFSVEEVRNLCKLINLAELLYFEYHKSFLEGFKRWKATPNNVEQRAEVFRLIGEAGTVLDIGFLDEAEIKKEFPWHWIDVAVNLDWDAAVRSVKEWLEVNKDFTPIIQRLPYWWDLHKNKEEYYETLTDLLKAAVSEEDVETVKLFLESFEVPAKKIAKIIASSKQLDDINKQFIKDTFSKRHFYPLIVIQSSRPARRVQALQGYG